MKTLLSNTILLLLISFSLAAQTSFQKTYGVSGEENREQGYAVIPKGDNYLLLGSTNSFGDEFAMYLVEVDAEGEEVWSNTYSVGEGTNEGFAICEGQDGGHLLLGRATNDEGQAVLRALKIDDDGEEEWSKYYLSALASLGWSALPTSDEGYLIVGTSTNNQFLVCKLNSAGEIQWSSSHGVFSKAFNAVELSDGSYVITGVTTSLSPEGELTHHSMYLMKFSQDGEKLWEIEHKAEDAYFTRGFDLVEESNGNFVVLGSRSDTSQTNARMYIARFDLSGTYIQSRVIEKEGSHNANYVVEETSDGNFAFIGNVSPDGTSDSREGYILKTDKEFETIWEKFYGNDIGSSTLLFSGKATEDGGFAVLGGINNAGSNDFYFIKTLADGTISENVTGIKEIGNIGMNLAPNPATDQVAISLENEMNGPILIQLIDLNGRIVKEIEDYKRISTYRRDIPLDLQSGLYLISVNDGLNSEIRKLLIH